MKDAEKKPEQEIPVQDIPVPKAPSQDDFRYLTVATNGTTVNIIKQDVSNLELLTIANLLVVEAQKRMGMRG